MSHFSVLVIGKNVEKQLAPYQENNMDDCPKKFLKFKDVEAEYKKKYKSEKHEMILLKDGTYVSKYDKGYQKADGTPILPSGAKMVKANFNKLYKTFDEFMKQYGDYEKRDPKTKKYGYWENPNKKWDWYEVGGRWTGYFKLKAGAKGTVGRPGLMTAAPEAGYVDKAKKKDIDFNQMFEESEKEARKNYKLVQRFFGGTIPTIKTWDEILKNKKISIEKQRALYHSQPPIKQLRDGNMEGYTEKEMQYLRWVDLENFQFSEDAYAANARRGAVSTFAVLKDGKWFEKGQMGWFAMVSNEKKPKTWDRAFEKLLKDVPEDTELTIVDCHI